MNLCIKKKRNIISREGKKVCQEINLAHFFKIWQEYLQK